MVLYFCIAPMNTTLLTDEQLAALFLNKALHKDIRKDVVAELRRRDPDFEETIVARNRNETQFKLRQAGLPLRYKLLLVTLPFFFPFYLFLKTLSRNSETERVGFVILMLLFPIGFLSYYPNQNLAAGAKRKWWQYWLYLSLGFIFWLVVILLWAKVFFRAD
jgi:hypothetical protein